MNAEQDNAVERVRDTRAVLRTVTPAENTSSHVGDRYCGSQLHRSYPRAVQGKR